MLVKYAAEIQKKTIFDVLHQLVSYTDCLIGLGLQCLAAFSFGDAVWKLAQAPLINAKTTI